MQTYQALLETIPLLEEKIGYVFQNKELLILSMVHRSYVNENRKEIDIHNERLEFLGDSVLGLIITNLLYHRLPVNSEGSLSQFRSRMIESRACASYLQKLGIQEFILLGRGEARGEGKTKISILADAFEALVGAIFIDGGTESAISFITTHFAQDIETVLETPSRNYKAELQDLSQKKYKVVPTYKIVQEMGPDHEKTFHVMVSINTTEMGLGIGGSKKEAEQKAAFDALTKIGDHEQN